MMVMPMEMVIKMDKQGRVVLPKEIRENYNFNEDTELIIVEKEEGVIITTKKPKTALSTLFKEPIKIDPKKATLLKSA